MLKYTCRFLLAFLPLFPPLPAVCHSAAGEYGLVAQWVERRNNHAEEMVRFRSRPVCTRTFRVFIFLLTPRKDGEAVLPHKSMGVRHPKCPKGHGADCGKTLYRRLTASVMHRRRETAPCLQYRKCGWLQRPTTGGKPPVYAALRLHETEAALIAK